MKFSEALRRTMFEFDLTGVELSQGSGVSQNTISAFRKGKQGLSADNLEKLLDAMPPEARHHFLSLVDGQGVEV